MLLSIVFVCKYDTIQLQWEYKDDLYYIGYAALRFSLHVSTTQDNYNEKYSSIIHNCKNITLLILCPTLTVCKELNCHTVGQNWAESGTIRHIRQGI